MVFEYALTFTITTMYTMGLHFWSDMNERKVDSRRNHMMIGVTLAIGIISKQFYTLIIAGLIAIAIMQLLKYLEKKQGKVVFGDGDKEIVSWSVPGIALVFGFEIAAMFVGLLMVGFFILAFLRHKMFIEEQKFPGLIILSFAYILIMLVGWML